MSTGIGRTQRRILEMLDAASGCLTTVAVAETLGKPRQQIGRAMRSLARRELIELTLEPTLRAWPIGATERRRDYWESMESDFTVRRPPYCGPGCAQQHSDFNERHWG